MADGKRNLGQLVASWRFQVLEEIDRIEGRLTAAGIPNSEAAVVRDHLERARAAATTPPKGWRRPISWVTGVGIERSWVALHAARQALIMVLPPDDVRADAPMLRSKVVRYLSRKNPERAVYETWLRKVERGQAFDREQMRAIRTAVDRESDLKHSNIRRFRNGVLLLSVVSLVFLVVLAIQPSPAWLDICEPSTGQVAAGGADDEVAETETDDVADDATGTETTSTSEDAQGDADENAADGDESSCADIWQVELLGALGGLLAAAAALRRVPSTGEPYGLRRTQGFLKIPMGALTGLLGVLLLQADVIDGLEPQPVPAVLVYAALFGFSQQAVTRFVDKRGKDLLTTGSSEEEEEEPED